MIAQQWVTLLAYVVCLATTASAHPDFIVRRAAAPKTSERRHIHLNKRAPSHVEIAQANPAAKREIKHSEGGIAIPLDIRESRTAPYLGARSLGRRKEVKLGKKPQDGGGSSGGGSNDSGGSDPPTQQPTGDGNTFVLDYDFGFNVTLDGIDTSILIDGGQDLLANGPAEASDPFDAPASSDTGITWKNLAFGGKVHKSDVTFGNGQYTVKDVAYGSQEDSPKYAGSFGMGVPGQSFFGKDAPTGLSEAMSAQLNLASFSVVSLDDWTLLLGKDPFVDVDPKALFGSVTPELGGGWNGKGTFNGTEIVADFSPQNTKIYGDAKMIQAFFGDQQPTQRGDDTVSSFYDVPCTGGPPFEFAFGDTTSDQGTGFTVTLTGEATLYTDKDSSTGCTSVLVGQEPDPTHYATSWSLGNAFQYHLTPSFHWDDLQNPIINFFSRPDSLYSSSS